MLRSRAWQVYVLAGIVAVVAYLLLLPADLLSPAYDLVGAFAVVAIGCGFLLHRPPRLRPWLLFGAGLLAYLAGDVLFGILQSTGEVPTPSVCDPLYLGGVAVLALGIAELSGRDGDGIYRPAFLDAALVATASGVVAWELIIGPIVGSEGDPLAVAVAVAYPVLDLVLIGVLFRHLLAPGRMPRSLQLLVLGLAAFLASDLPYAWTSLNGTYASGIQDAGWLAGYVLFGAAALHPSMAQPVVAAPGPARLSAGRLALIGISLVVPLVALAWANVNSLADEVVLDGAALLVSAIVLTRLSGALFRAQQLLDEREIAMDALRTSQQRFRALFERSPVGTALLGPDGRVVDGNPAFARMLRRSRETLVGMTMEDVTHPDDAALSSGLVHELLEGRRDGYDVEKRYVGGDGTIVWARANAAAVDEDNLRGVVVMLEDITERRNLEDQLRQAARMEALGQLAGGVAHDFNNLLTSINGYADLLLDAPEATGPVQDDLREIRSAGERAAALTRQLLAFARRTVLQPEVVDPARLIRRLEPMLRRLVQEDIALSVRLETEDCRVLVDPSQLEQVVVNLFVNARDAMPSGGRMTIEAKVATHPLAVPPGDALRPVRCLAIAVRDTGTGMDPETRAHVFEPFFTTKPEGKGTGLGLATVYGIVSQSGGDVVVDSTAGRGSTFTVFLPLASGAPAPEEQPVRAGVTGGGERILLAEDSDPVRELAARMLRRFGYTVREACDAEAALALADTEPFDLLVTDVVMPGRHGPELAAALRERTPSLPVLYCSGYSDEPPEIAGPGTAFLGKPFAPDELATVVRSLLAGAASEPA